AIALEAAIADSSLLSGIDAVVHAAAVRHRHGVDAATYRASNVDLALRTMRASAAVGVRRFVFVSSVGVYGFPSRLPVTEAFPYAPRTLYSATKVEAEIILRRDAALLGIDLVIARPTIFYGAGDRSGMLTKMADMIRKGSYRIVGSGENVLHHAHVDDIVEGLWLAATRPEAAGEHVILAGPETTTLSELSALVARGVGRGLPWARVPGTLARAVATAADVAAYRGIAFRTREPPLNNEKLDVMTVSIAFDIDKARLLLGYAPAIGYAQGISRVLGQCG
ncbi:MAG: NAD-dependent epimerase/dehydratase family protein, partial [Polyangiaceae bacterium]